MNLNRTSPGNSAGTRPHTLAGFQRGWRWGPRPQTCSCAPEKGGGGEWGTHQKTIWPIDCQNLLPSKATHARACGKDTHQATINQQGIRGVGEGVDDATFKGKGLLVLARDVGLHVGRPAVGCHRAWRAPQVTRLRNRVGWNGGKGRGGGDCYTYKSSETSKRRERQPR